MDDAEKARRAHTVMCLLTLMENQLDFIEGEGKNEIKLLKATEKIKKILKVESFRQFHIYEQNR